MSALSSDDESGGGGDGDLEWWVPFLAVVITLGGCVAGKCARLASQDYVDAEVSALPTRDAGCGVLLRHVPVPVPGCALVPPS